MLVFNEVLTKGQSNNDTPTRVLACLTGFFPMQYSTILKSAELARGEMIYDVLIIGAGIEGSAAGYNLVKNEPDKRIVILEQVI